MNNNIGLYIFISNWNQKTLQIEYLEYILNQAQIPTQMQIFIVFFMKKIRHLKSITYNYNQDIWSRRVGIIFLFYLRRIIMYV